MEIITGTATTTEIIIVTAKIIVIIIGDDTSIAILINIIVPTSGKSQDSIYFSCNILQLKFSMIIAMSSSIEIIIAMSSSIEIIIAMS